MKNIKTIFSFIILILFISSCTSNWPRFRGPDDNLVSKGENLPTEWGNDKNIAWTYDIDGTSWGSPIIWGNKVFFSAAVLEKKAPRQAADTSQPTASQGNGENPPPPPPADNSYQNDIYRWELTCVDLNSGEELWKQVAHTGNPTIKTHAGNTYASETPVTDGKRVYVYFGMIGVYCFDMDGNPLWEKNLGAFETLNGWGTGSSPVIYNNILYIQVDNEQSSFVIALNAETGELKWKVGRDEKTNYSTPVIWKNNVRTELVTLGKTARSYNPENGDLNWQMSMLGNFSIPSPVYTADHIYIGNAGGPDGPGPFYSVKAGAVGDITPEEGSTTSEFVEWSVAKAGTGNPTPVLHNGLIYLLASRDGEVTCLDALSGEKVYNEKAEGTGACWASPWICNDKLYFYDERGTTQVIKAGKEFEVLYQNKIKDKFWASIAATNDAYILKGVKKLYCIKEK